MKQGMVIASIKTGDWQR